MAREIRRLDEDRSQVPVSNLAETGFTTDRIAQVLSVLPDDKIPMAKVEKQRLTAQGPVTHPIFYGRTIGTALASGIIPANYSAAELGPSLMAHWAIINPNLRPRSLIGVDSRQILVNNAQEAIKSFQAAGYLPPDGYEVIMGDHELELPPVDLKILSLVSQYEAGETVVVDWMMKNSQVGINADFVHGPVEVQSKDIKEGSVIPVNTRRNPNRGTGLGWLIGKPIDEKPTGKFYEAEWISTGEADPEHIKHLRFPDDEYKTKITVFKEGDKTYAEGWGLWPKPEASDDDVNTLITLRKMFHDLWGNITVASNQKRIWDGLACLGVPQEAAQKGYYTGFIINTAPKLAGPLLFIMLKRNWADLKYIYDNKPELLSQIGPGKAYPTLEDLNLTLDHALATGLHSKFELLSPPHFASITVRDEQLFKKLTSLFV
jgi:hypothetical protein